MSYKPEISSLVGLWTYWSFIADPDLATAFNDLEFGRANIKKGTKRPSASSGAGFTTRAGPWSSMDRSSTALHSRSGFRARGSSAVRSGSTTTSATSSSLLNGVDQRPAIVGTIARPIPHSSNGTAIAPAGVVAQWIAVRQDNPS